MTGLLRLAIEFFKTGLFAVGGGLATLPFLYAMGEATGWFTAQDVANMIAISESTPGPMGVNMATYVGFNSFGILGSLVGPLALVFPSVVIIVIISKILSKFKESKLVQDVFYGLRPASTGLIIAAGLGVAKIALLYVDNFIDTGNIFNLFNYKAIILAAVIFFVMRKKDLHPILVVVISAVIGILFKF
ncbi:chromate transporter [Frisingicoccus sp.]|uniref:chromate transporter n=1 Tax=Frisingicoccus sp. TaxID=1918627 RepID=UPI0038672A06